MVEIKPLNMKESFIAGFLKDKLVLSALSNFCFRVGSPCQGKSLPKVPRFEPQVLVWERVGGEGGGGDEGGLGREGGEGGWVQHLARLQVERAH